MLESGSFDSSTGIGVLSFVRTRKACVACAVAHEHTIPVLKQGLNRLRQTCAWASQRCAKFLELFDIGGWQIARFSPFFRPICAFWKIYILFIRRRRGG